MGVSGPISWSFSVSILMVFRGRFRLFWSGPISWLVFVSFLVRFRGRSDCLDLFWCSHMVLCLFSVVFVLLSIVLLDARDGWISGFWCFY